MHKDLTGDKTFVASQFERERKYWLEKLSGELQKTGFPPDFPPGTTGRKNETSRYRLPRELFQRLATIGNNSESRLHMLLVTGLNLLLYKYTGQTDIIVATPINKQETEGEFFNTVLALRTRIDEQISVKEFLLHIRQTILEARDHQNYPIETLPYDLNLAFTGDDFPLFEIAIVLQGIQDKEYLRQVPFNLVFSFQQTGDTLELIVDYNAGRYEKPTIERIANHYIHLVDAAFNQVELKLIEVPLLTEAEKTQVLIDFNRTGADYPREKTIHRCVEEQVEKTPANIAIEDRNRKLTYAELNRRSNWLALLLREKGIAVDTFAAIMLESSAEVLIAVLAVLKAGGAYLPMGYEYPEDRIHYLLENSGAKILLTRQALVQGKTISQPLLDLEDETLDQGDGGRENPAPVNGSSSLAYIIYTSGTTGEPKGVMVEHRGLVNYIWWAARLYVRNETLAFPLYTSISFDLTVTSIYTPLVTGNTIIVYGGIDKKFYIEDVIADNRVGVVKLTPSHLRMISQKTIKNSTIKRLIVGGEELETQLAGDIYKNFSGPNPVEIYNEYGPTETVVGSMIYRYDPGADQRGSVPIGEPIANTQVYLLNRHYQPVPVGAVGEIYISGDGLARGYFHNPRLTDEKFVPNPFIPGQKMYKTGDLAIRLPDGRIEYKGRIDHQVKIRGYRVETGEIESRIVQYQRMAHAQREQKENIVEKLDLKAIQYCRTCLIPVNYPGGIHFDEHGVCDICREFETYKDKAFAYFKTMEDFYRVVERAKKTKKGDYDCLMLYSGGKDSSYVLHRLKEMGLKVLAFTFDNGYISGTCWKNIARTTSLLKVDHIALESAAMKEIFVESLWSDYNVCNGCFKAVNTLGAKLAHDHNINLVISGLTRGQIFDIKLHGLFKLGVFTEEEIEERLRLFRENYHSMTHRTSRLIGIEITPSMLENIYFADYFRYDKISTGDIYAYLQQKDPQWVRPVDTGSSSSNCIINDVGTYVHLKDKGCHFYAPQLSWDCRLGTLTREEGLEEITGYKVDYPSAMRVLKEIGYYDAFTGAVVTEVKGEKGDKALCAYILADKAFDLAELRAYLTRQLPDYMIPTYFTRIDRIPLTPSGKVDRKALPEPELNAGGEYTAPRDALETKLVRVWAEVLGLKKDSIGIDTNFFEVGGHSLRATFLAAAVNKEFNAKMPLVKIFEQPTIRGQAEYIKQTAKEIFTAIQPVERKEYYRLSPAQSRLYILQQMEPGSPAYNIDLIVELEGLSDREKLEKAFRAVIQRHESLRTSIEIIKGEPVQRVHNEVEFEIEYFLATEDTLTKVFGSPEPFFQKGFWPPEAVIRNFILPFDLSRVPLLRVGLIETGEGKNILMVSMHHIITDALSHRLLLKDLLTLYSGGELGALPFQYKDYAHWQQSPAVKEAVQRQEQYWLKEYRGEIPLLDLPTDYPRPRMQSFAGNIIDFRLGEGQAAAIVRIAETVKATAFMVILALYNLFLSKITGQEEIIIGIDTAGRNHLGLEPIIGMFVNTLPLRNFPGGDAPGKTFNRFLQEVKERSLEAFENQDYPFENLVEKLSIPRDTSRNPLFDAFFSYLEIDPRTGAGGGDEAGATPLKIKPYKYESKTAKFDITLNTRQVGEDLFFSFEYCTELFKEETIRRFIDYFKQAAAGAAAEPDREIPGIEIITREEKHRVLFEINKTGKPVERDKDYARLYGEQAERTPGKTAVVRDDLSLTYRELEAQAEGIAAFLRTHGVTVETNALVALNLDRSPALLASIIGTFKAGGAYVPLETNYPPQRIKDILEDSEAAVLITAGPDGAASVTVNLNKSFLGVQGAIFQKSPLVAEGNKLAYLIYTSGSTGRPKGVMIHRLGMINHLYAKINDLGITGEDIIAQTAPVSFDISVWQLLAGLLVGGRTFIVDREIVLEPRGYLQELRRGRVTILESVPSLIGAVLETAEKGSDNRLPNLRWMIPTGEPLTPRLVREWNRHYPRVPLVNAYGPTEASDDITHYLVKEMPGETQPTIPIGKPLQNLQVYVLDRHLNLCPVGIRGEICVAGLGVGKGYWKDEEKTRASFIPNPFLKEIGDQDYAVLYKTGDIGYFREDGNLECLGRLDHQVKIRGNRIELGEIEKQLSHHPGVKEAVVIDRADNTGGKYLCAYVVPKVLGTTPPGELTGYLTRALPDYMVPSYIMEIEVLPLTAAGKIDRKALPEPGIKPAVDLVPPGSPEEEQLAGIWAELLGIEKSVIGVTASFFDLGGHSLRATLLAARIHQVFKVKLPLAEVFKNPSIRGLGQYIREAGRVFYTAIEPTEKREYYPLSPAQKRIYLIQQTDFGSIAYNIVNVLVSEEPLDKERLAETFEKLVSRHESLRTSFEVIEKEPVQRIHEENYKLQITNYKQIPNHKSQITNQGVPYGGYGAPGQLVKCQGRGEVSSPLIDSFIRPFDLSCAPLLRIGVIEIADGKNILMVDMHHIITDGVSHGILVKEFSMLYAGEEPGKLRLQYKDFSQWRRRMEETGEIKKQEAYWKEQFPGEVPVLNLPLDNPRLAVQDFEGDTVEFNLGSRETGRLQDLAKAADATLFMVLLAIYNVLLSKLGGREDIVVGTGMAGRHHAGLENIIGMFVNTLALRSYPTGDKTFEGFLREVKERTLQAMENQDYPFEELAARLVKVRDFSRNPLFDTVFVQENPTAVNENPTAKGAPLNLKPYGYTKPTAQFDINFSFMEMGVEVKFSVVYRTKLFKKETIEMVIDFYKQIAARVIEDPGVRLKDIHLTGEVERMEVELASEHTGDFDF